MAIYHLRLTSFMINGVLMIVHTYIYRQILSYFFKIRDKSLSFLTLQGVWLFYYGYMFFMSFYIFLFILFFILWVMYKRNLIGNNIKKIKKKCF